MQHNRESIAQFPPPFFLNESFEIIFHVEINVFVVWIGFVTPIDGKESSYKNGGFQIIDWVGCPLNLVKKTS